MVGSEPRGPDAVLAGHRLGGGANDFMSEMNPDPEDSAEDNSPTVPTIEEERHFLAQCEYVNRSITAFGTKLRRLLFERGWQSEFSRVDQEVIWSKTFPDGARACLNDNDAYGYEFNYTRRFFRDTGIAMKPRKQPKPPQSGEQ